MLAQNCEAWFEIEIQETAPPTYIFYDVSPQDPNDPIIGWIWDFGNGIVIPNAVVVDHVFEADGTYEVCLTITTESGCSATSCQPIVVEGSGNNNCFVFPSFFAAVNGNEVAFSPFFMPPMPDMIYAWEFGDGETSTEEAPTHIYDAAGEYEVCMTLSTPDCPPVTYCNSVVVLDPDGCQANFSWEYQWGDPNTDPAFPFGSSSTVCFSNTSFGNVASLEWILSNGDVYTDEEFCHTFEPGEQEICLVITTDNGCTDELCQSVYIEEPFCEANFGYEVNGLTISFNDICWFPAVEWNWDFGDGSTSTEQNPEHTYDAPGEYEVCLSVVTTDGCESTICMPVIIDDPADCQAHFQYWQEELWDPDGTPNNTFGGTTLCFQSNSSGGANSWLWSFGDGTTGSEEYICHEFPAAGEYEVCLTIENDFGCSSTICLNVTVEEVEPYCQPFFGYEVNGLTVSFVDFCWNPAIAWNWTFGDGNSSTEQNPEYTYAAPGEYEICLTATTEDGCTATYCEIVVISDPSECVAEFGYWTGDPNGGPDILPIDPTLGNGLTVCFQSYSLNAGAWEWTFGDGNIGDEQFVCHTYDAAGEYEVCLTVLNDFGCTDTQCQTVVVEEWEPFCAPFFVYEVNGNSVMFNDASWSEAVTWEWDFGDGNSSTEQNPEHAYLEPGEYEVCLTATFVDGCVETLCQVVHVAAEGDCEAQFELLFLPDITMPPIVPNSYCFESTSVGAGYWFWDFGDGNTFDGEPTACHTFDAEGIYTVCLTIENDFGCVSDFCLDVEVGEDINPDCEVWLEVGQNAPANPEVEFAASGTGNFIQFVWDFGDGEIVTLEDDPYTVHTFPDVGEYEVCLTATTADGCSATSCQIVYISGGLPTEFDICGYATISDAAIPFGTEPAIVYLIEMDGIAGTLTAVDSLITPNTGEFCFYGLDLGKIYFLKAALLPDSPNYIDFLPTYFGDALYWYEATPIVPEFPTYVAVITLIAGDNPGGPGFVGGLITEGAGKAEGGTGIPNVEVILLNESGEPVAYTYTDEEGNYTFNNIAYGKLYRCG